MEPHGGNVYACSRRHGIPVEKVLDFSASINPLGPSLSAVNAVLEGLNGVVNYPDPDSSMLCEAVSAKFGIPPESVLPGNGSTEFIYLLPRVLAPEFALVVEPGFSDYSRASRLAGARLRKIYLDEREGFRPDTGRIASALGVSDLAFICNPNNPTGVLMGREEVLSLIEAARSKDTFLVIDEAFVDYAPEESVIAEASDLQNVAVLRNFTKFYGMPGIRSGYLVSHPDTVARLKTHKEPWTVNTLAEVASVAALGDEDYADASLRLMDEERPFMYESLKGLPGFKPYMAGANFMLSRLKLPEMDATWLASALEQGGILIRDCSNFEVLGPEYIRVAVRTRKENERLIGELNRLTNFTLDA